ncbi:endonuclease domain-containing protein [Leucobacter sp. wl10]|uniref:endonuclease domain-containing protein n=1 Tax=Leucobacter sp. wl10 TaxID=2304677 RepID=UPI000E5AB18D|nr:DUF559 domain-containing protein [Leucobacter sp. wl10]RGE23351.1 DUF559 domain-containing protein [Leucobacter sp. wl10]
MSLEQDLREMHGVAPTAKLLRLGHSRHRIAVAVAEGRLTRPRRGWIALRSADPGLVMAAHHGVVLTCVTQAKRLGLWVLEHQRLHVAAKPGAHIEVGIGTVHWRRPLILRPPGTVADRIENVLDQIAHCQPHDAALAVWDSALQRGLIDYPALTTLPLRGNARVLLEECTPFADSGLETLFRTRFGWLRLPIRQQSRAHGRRVDIRIGDRLIIQIDGLTHTGAQRDSDNVHDAELAIRGYHVIRVSYQQVVHRWHEVEDLVLGAIARGLHLAP